MELQRVAEDLLLTSSNENWMQKVLIATHIISDKMEDIYNSSSRNYIKGIKMNYPALLKFSECDFLVVIDRIIDIYVFPKDFGFRRSKDVLNIVGHNCSIKNMTKIMARKQILNKKEEFSFLQDGEYKILYFPFHKEGEELEFNIFREIGKNTFLINSLSNNLSAKSENIRSGFTRKDIIEMVLEDIYEEEDNS